MNTTLRITSVLAVVALGFVATQPAVAAPLPHVYHEVHALDRLAVRLTQESDTLYQELRAYGGRNPALRVAMNEVRQITRQADRLHAAIHAGRNPRYLHRDIEALQDLVHHVHDHLAPYRHFRSHVNEMDRLAHAIDECLHDLVAAPLPTSPTRYPANVIARPGFSIQIGR